MTNRPSKIAHPGSLVALLGRPVAHSLSPLMHNTAFRAQDVSHVYVAFEVAPQALGEAVAGLRALGLAGANVTVPHKEAVVEHLDALTERAEAVGAVNTLFWKKNGALTGDNTDAAGFLAPLEHLRGGRGGASRHLRAAHVGVCAPPPHAGSAHPQQGRAPGGGPRALRRKRRAGGRAGGRGRRSRALRAPAGQRHAAGDGAGPRGHAVV